MRRISIFGIGALLIGLIIGYCYNNFLSPNAIIGKYANKNFNHSHFLAEIPYVTDKLVLFRNNRFESTYWGKGSYHITYSLQGTKIQLKYKYSFGLAGYKASIERLNWGTPKIILDRDRNHYYEKIE